ncbi:MAG: transglutaminase-like domain-containing protein [Polyangiaceae bacterium]
MCMRTTSVLGTGIWNWAGDDVVFDHIVPSHRRAANTNVSYQVDIRQFLTTKNNAVIRRAMDEAVRELDSPSDRELFFSRSRGAFDHRVIVLTAFVNRRISYRQRGTRRPDAWQFPEETLALGSGDCEDMAFLLVSLLLASGVSGYMLRVALGRLVTRGADGVRIGKGRDHAWVVYQSERGHWLVLDPLLYFKESPTTKVADTEIVHREERYEYVPYFVFNDEHLWSIRRNNVENTLLDYVCERDYFEEFEPRFLVNVHNHIFDVALGAMPWIRRQYVKAVSLAADANLLTYDPRDHFDNGYIEEGFTLVARRLTSKMLGDFGLAAHAVSDFYAHSTYELFGASEHGRLLPYDPERPRLATIPDYGPESACPLADPRRFTVNEGTYRGSRADAASHWNGRIITGRYAQNGDPHQGVAERLTYIPKALRDRSDYAERAMLPHHDEIAVDSAARGARHRLYETSDAYARAFGRRQAAAIQHVKSMYRRWTA